MTPCIGGFTPGHRRLIKSETKMDNTTSIDNKSKMIEDFGSLLSDKHFSDVVFHFNDGSILHAHKLVLIARSPVFAAMFLKGDYKEAKNGRVDICDIQSDVFFQMLSYLYTTKVPKMSKLAFELHVAADKYDLPELKTMCEKELIKHLSPETMLPYYELGDKNNSSELKQKALVYMSDWAKKKIDAMTGNSAAIMNVVKYLKGVNSQESSDDYIFTTFEI